MIIKLTKATNENSLMKTNCRALCDSLSAALVAGAVLLMAGGAPAQNLFVLDSGDGTIYEFTPDGARTAFAYGLAGPALAINSVGDLFLANFFGGSISEITPGGAQSIFASGLSYPTGLAINRAGDLFVGFSLETYPNTGGIIEITPHGAQRAFVSGLIDPQAVAFNSAGELFVADDDGTLYEFTPRGAKSTFASGLVATAGLAFNSAGDLFAADNYDGVIYEFTPGGAKSTFAAGLSYPQGLAFNSAGDLFEADYGSGNIYEFTPDGTQFIFASGLALPAGLAFAARSAPTQTAYVGNPALPFVDYAQPDGVPPLVILGEYSPAGPLPTSIQTLPSGTVEDVKFYGQNYDFTLYALSLPQSHRKSNEQKFKVVASQHFSGSNPIPGTITLAVSDFRVKDGDFLAFAGIGPYYPQQPNDALNTDATYEDSVQPVGYDNDTATPPGGPETVFTVGLNRDASATYEYIADNFGNQGRVYAIGVDVRLERGHRQPHDHDDLGRGDP